MTILVDGGLRNGNDIFKALALGADAAILARPHVTAVYGGGTEGVRALTQKLMAELEDTLATHLPHHLTLDLSGITFMDSSGIALLLRTHRRVTGFGGTMRVTHIPTQPRRVLDAAGVGRIISLE